MQHHKLARIRWQVGQTILPEHFRAQDEAFSAEVQLHAGLSGLPQVGIASLRWSEVMLGEGILSISSMTAVMPGGIPVDVPGNAVLPPLSLEATGRAEVTVHLHLMEDARGAEGVPLYADEPPNVQRVLRAMQLSSEPSVDHAVSSLELTAFSKDLKGAWRPSPRRVPQLLQVGPNPFLDELFGQLDTLLEKAHGQLRSLLLDSYQRGSGWPAPGAPCWRSAASRRCAWTCRTASAPTRTSSSTPCAASTSRCAATWSWSRTAPCRATSTATWARGCGGGWSCSTGRSGPRTPGSPTSPSRAPTASSSSGRCPRWSRACRASCTCWCAAKIPAGRPPSRG